VAYVGNDTLLSVGGNDVHWNGKRWLAVGNNSNNVPSTSTGSATAVTSSVVVTNNNTTPFAISDDGITWSSVPSNQVPDMTECTFIATNSRIGATPLIDSQITIADNGDTEITSDYGNIGSGNNTSGIGSGIAQIDIIGENPVISSAASGTGGSSVTNLGVGTNNQNGMGNTTTSSFDSTAFTITIRPLP
jgi:hypothetical protein